jgi:ribosomal protein S6E (S10)
MMPIPESLSKNVVSVNGDAHDDAVRLGGAGELNVLGGKQDQGTPGHHGVQGLRGQQCLRARACGPPMRSGSALHVCGPAGSANRGWR